MVRGSQATKIGKSHQGNIQNIVPSAMLWILLKLHMDLILKIPIVIHMVLPQINFNKLLMLCPRWLNIDAYASTTGLSFFPYALINFIFRRSWILYSEAIGHLIYDSALATEKESLLILIVNLLVGSSAYITCTGVIHFNKDITLNNILYISYSNVSQQALKGSGGGD